MEKKSKMKTRRMKNKPAIKRLLANKCERERVRKINEAFEILKTHIPCYDSGQIRTKLDVLRFAIDYIQILTKMTSQSETTSLLTTQREKSGFMPNTSENQEDARIHGTGHYLSEEHQSSMGLASPVLSDDGAFFLGDTKEENSMNKYLFDEHWSGQQCEYQEVYEISQHTHQHTNESSQDMRATSLAAQQQNSQSLMAQWNYHDFPMMPMEGQTTPVRDDDYELISWLNS